MHVVVTGSLGYDYIMNFPGRFADRIIPDKIHSLSLSFLVDHLSKQFGGTAGNVAYTLKLLGMEPTILSVAGGDFLPYKQFLEQHKISTKYIAIHNDVSTSAYFVMTDKEDNQIGSFYMGATQYAKNLTLSSPRTRGSRDKKLDPRVKSQGIPLGPEDDKRPFVILGPTDPAAMKKHVKECRKLNLSYLYDPAFQIAAFMGDELREGIEGAQMLIGNDYEIALIEQKLEILHEELIRMVPILITTLGSKGSVIETRRDAIHVRPAKPQNTSDPTGAGDAYRAGFVAGYLRFASRYNSPVPPLVKRGLGGVRGGRGELSPLTGDELLICGQMGSVAAAYAVETYGTQTHTFTKNEFTKRYFESYGSQLRL